MLLNDPCLNECHILMTDQHLECLVHVLCMFMKTVVSFVWPVRTLPLANYLCFKFQRCSHIRHLDDSRRPGTKSTHTFRILRKFLRRTQPLSDCFILTIRLVYSLDRHMPRHPSIYLSIYHNKTEA